MRSNSVSPPDPATPHSKAEAALLGERGPLPRRKHILERSSICHATQAHLADRVGRRTDRIDRGAKVAPLRLSRPGIPRALAGCSGPASSRQLPDKVGGRSGVAADTIRVEVRGRMGTKKGQISA